MEARISKSDIAITPQSDGKLIRLPVPALSTERRNKLAAQVKEMAEKQKVSISNLRRDANKTLETSQKAASITEDELESGKEQIQKLTDDYTAKVDKMLEE